MTDETGLLAMTDVDGLLAMTDETGLLAMTVVWTAIKMYIIYDFIFLIFAFLYLPYFLLKGKFHKDIWQRLGYYPRRKKVTVTFGDCHFFPFFPIWLHAVSVGEVAAMRPLWERLRQEFPSQGLAVSTVTKTGNDMARRFADREEAVLYLPLDISVIVRAALERLNPRALIIAETELWPNLINGCYKRGIPVILVNGRISNKAFKRYRLVRFILRHTLERIRLICVQTEEDRRRFIYLGAPSGNVKVAGNMKYDNRDCFALDTSCQGLAMTGKAGLLAMTDETRHCEEPLTSKMSRATKQSLGLDGQKIVIVAGSTHRGEEKIILGVFERLLRDFPEMRLIIAPRHIERANEVRRLVKEGLPVNVVDRMGALRDLYSGSDIVFIGGSLIRHGGHNIIEPAVFGKPILFGPHMFNFQEVANEFLKAGAAVMVEDAKGLEDNLRRLLIEPGERQRLGGNAKKVVLNNQGAVERCVYEIKKIIG